MKLFYIPDGHRRYMDREGCSLSEAYRVGYAVLVDEIIRPLFTTPDVARLDIFLLSSLNLQRRDSEDLRLLLELGEELLPALIAECGRIASVRTLGNYFANNIRIDSVPGRQINLILGSRTSDQINCSEVDIFIRSGGELRLSGAPRSIIGDYTQFYRIDKLHPDLRFHDIRRCLDEYQQRYMRESSILSPA
jgi:undecaprenyl pyrophosphate synthase